MSPRREVIGDTDAVSASASEDALPALHRAVSPEADEVEVGLEASVRPRRLGEFVGQTTLKEKLSIVLEAARRRDQPVDHMLFAGPPGLGKTTLAGIVAAEMGTGFRITSGPALTRGGDLAAILTGLQHGDVLFIDEIHRLNRAVEEILYPAMEDFAIDLIIGKGPSARSVRLALPRFTLIGATTRSGLVTGPLRDRFGFVTHLEHYRIDELCQIVARTGELLGVECTDGGAREIARRSRGTPRLAIRLVRRVRDFVEVRGTGTISLEAAREGCTVFGVDDLGLDQLDLKILNTICRGFTGGPVGLTTLAASLSEDADTIEDVAEPFLMQAGLLQRTARGRMATAAAFAHLGMDGPPLRASTDRPPGIFEVALFPTT